MRHDRERLDTEAGQVGSASGGSPGKRALTDRLPPRGREGAPAGAPGEAERAGGGEQEDPFWWADGARAEEDGGGGTIDRATMQALYYGINPPRHAEKAYQAEDSAPPLHPRPTTVGKSGTIVALATTIYNRPPFGKVAQFSVCDRGGRVLRAESVKTPGRVELDGFAPGTEVLIRPETIGTMVKLLTPEQIAGAEERGGDGRE